MEDKPHTETFHSEPTTIEEAKLAYDVVGEGLLLTLQELARLHDYKFGPWLDDLEKSIKQKIKARPDAAKYFMATHAGPIGISLIEGLFASARAGLKR